MKWETRRFLGCMPSWKWGLEAVPLKSPRSQVVYSSDASSSLTDHSPNSQNTDEMESLPPFKGGTAYDKLPSDFYEDIQLAFFLATNELDGDWKPLPGKLINDDVNSDEAGDLEMLTKSECLGLEGNEMEISSLERMPEPEQPSPSQREARKTVRYKLQEKMFKWVFSAEDINKQLAREDSMWLFCNLFPQNYEFKRDTLVELWIARGFVNDGYYQKHIADYYFDALLAEGCIQSSGTNYRTGITKYSVNVDKLNNSSKAKPPYLRFSDSDRLEELSLEGDDADQTTFEQIKSFQKLKVLLFLSNADEEIRPTTRATNKVIIPHDIFSTLKHLQVLDLSGLCIDDLPSSIGEVVDLRYLDLSFTLIEELPETIDCLQKLQTLKLRGCARLFRLPAGIVKLRQLKHLDVSILGQLTCLPKGMGALTNLETLSAFPVDRDDGRGISELQKMDNLREHFCISQLERVSTAEEARQAALSQKENLKKLELRWTVPRSNGIKVQNHEYQVLSQLHPPSSLQHLEISGYSGLTFPDWFHDSSLDMLVSITLVRCNNSKELPSLGKLQFLKFLQLIGITRVKSLSSTFRGHVSGAAFPVLEKFLIVGMSYLETWEEIREGDFPKLLKLTIEACPKLVRISTLSYLQSLRRLEMRQCAKLSYISIQGKLPAFLETLIIDICPSLKRRYKRTDDKYSHEIKHVKNVWIDDQELRSTSLLT